MTKSPLRELQIEDPLSACPMSRARWSTDRKACADGLDSIWVSALLLILGKQRNTNDLRLNNDGEGPRM